MRGNGGLRHGTRGTEPGRGDSGHPAGRRSQYGTGVAARGMECWRGITGRRKPREVDVGRGGHRNSAPAEDGRGVRGQVTHRGHAAHSGATAGPSSVNGRGHNMRRVAWVTRRAVARVAHCSVRNAWAVPRMMSWEAWWRMADGWALGWMGGWRSGCSHGLLAVRLEVLEHVVLADEALAALLASEGLLAGVEAHVATQVRLMIELLRAHLAFIRLIARVLGLVVTEGELVGETFTTGAALEGLLPFVVGGAVLGQVTHAVEEFATVSTPISTLVCVRAAAGATRLAGVHGSLGTGVSSRRFRGAGGPT